ncbi:MAG: monofunctional biosynthetic peptidoglycan transglycosylase [Deltaproteobacteria bacterium]|nr:monofunctional biosynthetic peptidoglycan transglycosylase [Deltaproteobacteria bacterium]
MKKLLYILPALAFSVAALYFFAVPDVSFLVKENPLKTSLMRFREAEWKAKGREKDVYQTWVPYSRISPYLVKATLISEDDKFWSHEGFDYDAIQRAIEKDIKAGKFKAGGSTISQQLAKNLFLTPEKSAFRKFREALITWKIERTLSKKRILELYLNVAEWGDGVYGAEAASRHYFGKSASGLTAMEAARLSVVLPSPRRLNASGDQKYVNSRAEIIYDIMVKRGIVVPEFEEVEAETKAEAAKGPGASGIIAGGPLEGSAAWPQKDEAAAPAGTPLKEPASRDEPRPADFGKQ